VDACVVTAPNGSVVTHVTVRDFANNPVAASTVVLDYTDCPAFRLCTLACSQCIVDLPTHTVRMLTNAAGQADFDLRAGGGCAAGALRVYADGVFLAQRAVAAFDQDGDLAVTATDYLIAQTKQGLADPTADFDCSGLVDLADLNALNDRVITTCDGIVPAQPRTWGRLKIVYR
jgi:hypothetical protein